MGESYKIPKAEEIDFERLQREAAAKKETAKEEAVIMAHRELDSLVDNGIEYTMVYTRRLLFLRKTKRITFSVYEPTLAVLDQICSEAIDITLDDDELAKGGAETIKSAMRVVTDNTARMARIVALATLGEQAFDTMPWGTGRLNKGRVNKLARVIEHSATSTQLTHLTTAVLDRLNLGSFLQSTRLMGATMKKRTELVE